MTATFERRGQEGVDDLTLSESEANKPLNLTLELSTYYRLGANGT